MSTVKVVEVRPEGVSPFIKYLKFLSEKKGWGWNIETVPDFSKDLFNQATALKIAPALADSVLPQITVTPTLVRNVECLDSFFKEGAAWYPRLLIHEALRLVLISEARDLDILAPAFVVGDNNDARVAAAVLAEMGISEVYLIGNPDKLQNHQRILSRSQVGVKFNIMAAEDLTLQAVNVGIVINTENLTEQKALLVDLSYFNFMKRLGYVLDANLLPVQNLLLEEAEKADLRVLSPVLVAKVYTRLWLERMLPEEQQLSRQEIDDSWTEFLKTMS